VTTESGQLALPLEGSGKARGRKSPADKESILRHWYCSPEFCIDLGEPLCWACRDTFRGRHFVVAANPTWQHYVRAWTRAPLQRCHIIPRSMGGSNDASNLVLMCATCHDFAPDTTDPAYFFDWMRAQSCYVRRWREFQDAMRSFGADGTDPQTARILSGMLADPRFNEWADARMGLHCSQRHGGVGYSVSSLVAVALSYAKEVLGTPIPRRGAPHADLLARPARGR
jgi:hypothetical protein